MVRSAELADGRGPSLVRRRLNRNQTELPRRPSRMGTYHRRGHYRRGANGSVHWVSGHNVTRGRRSPANPAYWQARPRPVSARAATPSCPPRPILSPNARCPVCGAWVYFYANEHGSRVYFDELGPPWPKHPCVVGGQPADTGQQVIRPGGSADFAPAQWSIHQGAGSPAAADGRRFATRLPDPSVSRGVVVRVGPDAKPGSSSVDPPIGTRSGSFRVTRCPVLATRPSSRTDSSSGSRAQRCG